MIEQNDLIAAVATPEAVSAIAVIRLSGIGATEAVEKLMDLTPGRLNGMRRVVGDFAGIDNLVAVSWPRGKSYTGEEMVDLMCHGAPGIPAEILAELERAGARRAEPGEFTRRAWLNGNLTEMDVMLLSAAYRNIRVENPSGIISSLNLLLAETEALIEFGEEHEIGNTDEIKKLLEEAGTVISSIGDKLARLEILPRVFIMGPVNAGKSTLFNILCGKKAALVSEVPGTTRDGAEQTIFIRGRQVNLCDTAGTGGTGLDGIALEIAIERISDGDRILWLDPMQEEPPEWITANRSVMKVASRNDESGTVPEAGWHPFTAVSQKGIEEIISFITSLEKGSPSSVFIESHKKLCLAENAYENGDLALVSELVNGIMEDLNSPSSGPRAVERALEMFCVGK